MQRIHHHIQVPERLWAGVICAKGRVDSCRSVRVFLFQDVQYVLTKSGYLISHNVPDNVIVNPEVMVDEPG